MEQVIEEWVTVSLLPCARCQALSGAQRAPRWPRGEGPQPIIDTHPNCRCFRVAVSGRFASRAEGLRQRAQLKSKRRG